MASAKRRSSIRRIIPFGIFWTIFGALYSIVVKGVLADSTTYPASGVPYDFASSLASTVPACLVMGLLMGALEVHIVHRLFRTPNFWVRLLLKASAYTAAFVVFLLSINTLYLSAVLHVPIYATEIMGRNVHAFQAWWFWSIVLYIGTVAALSLLLNEFQQHIGLGVVRNFFAGTYHSPKEEERVFMFLDMKSSTTIAEQMGHVKYFGSLNRYYADMTEAIIASSGQICQYVGDEVVITWTLRDGLRSNDCLECFFRIKDQLEAEASHYVKAFGHAPGFKAGLHCGHVTTGEIGSVRKDIVFTGDVMNTTARIQSLCNENGVDLLVSETLVRQLDLTAYTVQEIGVRELKGKDERVKLFTVRK